MSKVHVMDHPLISHKISYIRKEDLGSKDFREMISEIAMLICYEATRDLKLQDVKIKTPICEMTGKELSDILLDKYNIQIEMAGPHHIIAMTSVADDPKGIKKFVKAIRDIDKKLERKYIDKLPLKISPVREPEITPRDVYYSEKEYVPIDQGEGRIPAGIIMAYPPGIPIVSVGEILTKSHIEQIETLKKLNIDVIGVDNDEILVVK